MRTYQIIVVALSFALARMSGPASRSPAGITEKEAPKELIFVRQFFSAEDVERGHPLLDRSLDIIAALKMQDPQLCSTGTQCSDNRFPASGLRDDARARAVHVFDFANSKYSRLRGGDHLGLPVGVAADREGNVYVSDSDWRRSLSMIHAASSSAT